MGQRSATIDRDAPSIPLTDPSYERLGFQLIRELRVGSSHPLRLTLRPSMPSGVRR
jgi:hypothetical protein